MDQEPGCSTWPCEQDSNPEVCAEDVDQQQGRSKRSSEPESNSEDSVVAKKSRLSQINLHNSTSITDRAGVIQKLVVKNFMCHSYLEVAFNRSLNFVIGRNGSGKSAILAALVVGLGGNASVTNRGASVKEFIKKGFNSSTIEITLSNTGFNNYKPDVYGESIVVERNLNSSAGSSGYKIKAANGVVQSKKRSELDELIDCYNIQVDNPISVLNQDTARSFLNSSNPHDKYELFMKASQLDLLWETQKNTTEIKRKAVMSLNEKKASLSVTKKELRELELRWNRVKAVSGYRKKIVDLRDELNWVVADCHERRLALVIERRVEEEGKLPPLLAKIESYTRQESEKKTQSAAVESRMNALLADANVNEDQIQEAKTTAGRRNEAYATKLKSYKSLKVKIDRLQVNVDSLLKEVDRLQKISDPQEKERQSQIRKKMALLDQKCIEMTDTIQPLNHHLGQVQEQSAKQKELLQQKKMETLELNKRTNKLQEEIASLKSSSSDKLSVYGSLMPVLVQRIEDAGRKGMFEKLPVGPVGAHLELRDASWAPAIESFLGATLRTFCVDNTKDAKTLSQLIKSVYNGKQQRPPAVVNSKFFDAVHDVRKYAVQPPAGMFSVLDALIIDHPVVANCLIDQRELESILLIPNLQEACDLMSDTQTVPLNCKRAITREGDTLYPDPNYRCYSGSVSAQAQYLHVSMAEVVAYKEKELNACRNCLKAREVEILQLQVALKDNVAEISRVQKEKNNINQKLLSMRAEVEALKDIEEPEPTTIATLLAEVEETSAQRDVFKGEELHLEQECNTRKEELGEAKRAVAALYEERRKLESAEGPLRAELETLRDEVNELAKEKTYAARKVEEVRDRVRRIVVREEEQRTTTETAIDVAQKVHPERIDSTRSPGELNEEIRFLELTVANVEKDHGNFNDVVQELREKKERYNEISANIQSVDKALTVLDKVLTKREKMYTHIQSLVSVRVSQLFTMMLHERKYSGEIDIDHENKVLEIVAHPSSRDGTAGGNTRTLSGGERSYTTVMFIIALWDVANTPFYFLDEFDVFMDKVNRRVALEMLTTQAASKRTCQFVFLTPQDLSSVAASSDITIHRMENPREEIGT